MECSWSPDVCVHCEQPISGGTSGAYYCSQSCRLANIPSSNVSSKTNSPSGSSSSTRPSKPYTRETALQLQPAIDFSSYRLASSSYNAPRRSVYSQPLYSSSPFPGNSNSSRFAAPPPRVLTPSTSRSSLSSVSSNSSQCSGLSDRTRDELRSYSNSFDLIRNWKRRMTSNYP